MRAAGNVERLRQLGNVEGNVEMVVNPDERPAEDRAFCGEEVGGGASDERSALRLGGEGHAHRVPMTEGASCKTPQISQGHGLLSLLGEKESWSFGDVLKFSPDLQNS